jgi:hypothetical protein
VTRLEIAVGSLRAIAKDGGLLIYAAVGSLGGSEPPRGKRSGCAWYAARSTAARALPLGRSIGVNGALNFPRYDGDRVRLVKRRGVEQTKRFLEIGAGPSRRPRLRCDRAFVVDGDRRLGYVVHDRARA